MRLLSIGMSAYLTHPFAAWVEITCLVLLFLMMIFSPQTLELQR
jgi:hypothetical protein